MPSGGSFFVEEKTCNFRKLWYDHHTLGWDMVSTLDEGNRLTHVFDPCWNQSERLPAEVEMHTPSRNDSRTADVRHPDR